MSGALRPRVSERGACTVILPSGMTVRALFYSRMFTEMKTAGRFCLQGIHARKTGKVSGKKGDHMDRNGKEIGRLQAAECIKNLKAHNFDADFFETKEEVLSYLKEHIKKGSSIGIGGSVTLKETGILQWLTGNEDYRFLDRYHTDDVKQVFRDSFSADVYLMSANAVTLNGCLYNVDGNGNRVAALIYGPDKVYVIAGVNKIVPDLDAAIERVKQTAAPVNNVRLGLANPCTKLGRCAQCLSESSICNEFVVTRRSGVKGRIHVLLAGEELGY